LSRSAISSIEKFADRRDPGGLALCSLRFVVSTSAVELFAGLVIEARQHGVSVTQLAPHQANGG
jgi:hypothetical protein